MDVTGIWQGMIDGTNWGSLLMKFEQSADSIKGIAQVSDVEHGTYNLVILGKHQDGTIILSLTPAAAGRYSVRVFEGSVDAVARQKSENVIEGEWKSSRGTYGSFQVERQPKDLSPEALATKVSEANAAFIMMAFTDRGQGLLPGVDILNAIKRACEKAGVQAHRADEVEHSGGVTGLIRDEIRTHRFLISDVTHQRPNVYYEVGYAHGLGKEVILTAQEGTEVHFDIAGHNILFYLSSTDLEDRILKRLRAKITAQERGRHVLTLKD